MSDRRRSPRFRVTLAGSVRFPLDARLLNVSRGGVALEAAEALTVGEVYAFEVHDRDRRIHIEFEVRWCTDTHEVDWPSGERAAVFHAGGPVRSIDGADDDARSGWWRLLARDLVSLTASA